jgi:hypothetical protein
MCLANARPWVSSLVSREKKITFLRRAVNRKDTGR